MAESPCLPFVKQVSNVRRHRRREADSLPTVMRASYRKKRNRRPRPNLVFSVVAASFFVPCDCKFLPPPRRTTHLRRNRLPPSLQRYLLPGDTAPTLASSGSVDLERLGTWFRQRSTGKACPRRRCRWLWSRRRHSLSCRVESAHQRLVPRCRVPMGTPQPPPLDSLPPSSLLDSQGWLRLIKGLQLVGEVVE